MENKFLEAAPSLRIRETNNPYRHSLSVVVDRFKWDLNYKSWSSRSKLKKWKGKHKGEKAVILCNGPSLNKVDLSSLKGVFTFGLNKINLLFNKSDFRPSVIVAVNSLVIEQNKDFYNCTDIPLFLDSESRQHINFRDNITFLKVSHQQKFACDVSMSLWQGGTVTFVAMQLAFHMGFQEVALVGCDHYFNSRGSRNQLAISAGKDDSHFDPNYFANGMKWHLPDIGTSEYGYYLADDMFRAHSRQIYNATEGGHLDIFERIRLEDFLKK